MSGEVTTSFRITLIIGDIIRSFIHNNLTRSLPGNLHRHAINKAHFDSTNITNKRKDPVLLRAQPVPSTHAGGRFHSLSDRV